MSGIWLACGMAPFFFEWSNNSILIHNVVTHYYTGSKDMETTRISVSDLPAEAGNDQLGNDKYADALVSFIHLSDTPITIGIQGGWGSGKTSLLNFISCKDADNSLIVKINAWEFSLFQEKDAIAFSLLGGLVAELGKSINTAHERKRISDETRKAALNLPNFGQLALQFGKGVFGNVLKAGINAATAGILNNNGASGAQADINLAGGNQSGNESKTTASVRELRDVLGKAINEVVADKLQKYKRILFMIDDLDRIDPTVALEVLDVLKNVMEMPNCVFILAIDYDVVVKGLTAKFGEKTEKNAREYRQYFDKIIQVPFSMPVSSYRDNIETLLKDLFERVGISIEHQRLEYFSDYAWKLTDGAPRSIKRIVNMVSLLKLLSGGTRGDQEELSLEELEILFVFVCLQINFPQVFNKIASSPDYVKWALDGALKMELSKLEDAEKEIFKNKSFDEEWEKVLYLLCKKDIWTQQKATGLSEILGDLYKNKIEPLTKVDDKSEDKSVAEVLAKILTAVSVTSIGDEIQLEKNHRQDQISKLCLGIAETLNLPSDGFAQKRGTSRYFTLNTDFCNIKIIFTENKDNAKGFSVDYEISVNELKGKIRPIRDWLKSTEKVQDFMKSPKYYNVFYRKKVFDFLLKDLKDNSSVLNAMVKDLKIINEFERELALVVK